MAQKKKKKAAVSNPARGFATTSLPSKSKIAAAAYTQQVDSSLANSTSTTGDGGGEGGGEGPQPQPQWVPPTEEELEREELLAVVTSHGQKAKRESQRSVNKCETEKRTYRTSSSSYPLRLDHILGVAHINASNVATSSAGSGLNELSLGERILELARTEYVEQLERSGRTKKTYDRDAERAFLVTAWTLHKTLVGLGFAIARADEAIRAVLGRQGSDKKDLDTLLEELLEWISYFCRPDELLMFLDTGFGIGTSVPKKDSNPSANSIKNAPVSFERVAGTRRNAKDPSQLVSVQTRGPANSTPLASDISNSTPRFKEVNEGGPDPDISEDEEYPEDESDEDHTPEDLIPTYLILQTKLYNIHPNCASTVIGGKKVKGGGKRPTKLAPQLPPKSLSEEHKRVVKRLQQKLANLERDPLFDSYIADTAWRDARSSLDEEAWKKKKMTEKPRVTSHPPPTTAPDPGTNNQDSTVEDAQSNTPKDEPQNDDTGLLGSLFDGPPTEENTGSGTNVFIRDFEDAKPNITTFAARYGKGNAGVGAAGMKKMMEEICKSRDAHAKVQFGLVPGTSVSSRSRLTIAWGSSLPDVQVSSDPKNGEDEPEVIVKALVDENKTVFEMRKMAAITSAQAEGYIVTYALFKLFSQKQEKLYLRFPTVWRNVWAELVEEEKTRADAEDVKTLQTLKELLRVSSETSGNEEQKAALVDQPISTSGSGETDGSRKVPKPAYEKYLKGDDLREAWLRRIETPAFRNMEAYRSTLPMWAYRENVLKAVEDNQVVVLSGETGCGKSTQLPTFLLQHELENGRLCKIYCTQPRRISAISLARRVAEEMGEGKNNVGGLVGYAIRLENMVSNATRLVYATTGIVMRMLEKSTELDDITHLILDEVHERSIETDFFLVVLKRLLVKRKDLKVILMSATVDAERFSDYLGGAPVLKVPGRTFPVQDFYLEDTIEATNFVVEDDPKNIRFRKNEWDDNDAELDFDNGSGCMGANLNTYKRETKVALSKIDHYRIPYDLILKLLEKIATDPEYTDYSKAILVFLPGMGEIRRLNDMILGHPLFGQYRNEKNGGGWLVYPLHSTIASEEQEQAFLIPPEGTRKIVLATNIAETGITIPDVTAVIDTGKHKEMRFDEKRQLSRLVETFVSRANAKQRRGRAGRVQPGICWHLFTRERHDKLLADQQTPEIMRLSLQDLVLRVKICGLGDVEEVLTSALDSPTAKNIRRAIDSLVEVKALTSDEELTPLGQQLAKLPLDVYLGKLVLVGCIFGCVDAVITMAAMLSSKNPFVSPGGYGGEAERAKLAFKRGDSDLLTAYNAYSAWRRVCSTRGGMSEGEFCRKNYISARTMSGIEDLKGQLSAAVVEAGFLKLSQSERNALNRARYATYRRTNFFIFPDHANQNTENDQILNAVVAAGFYPKLLVRDSKGWRNICSVKTVNVHHSSVNKFTDSTWLSYYGIMQAGSRLSDVYETGHVDEIAIALLCGDIEFRMFAGVASIDGNRIRFSFSDWKGILAVKVLRQKFREIMTKGLRYPDREMTSSQNQWLALFFEAVSKAKVEKIGRASTNTTG